jgi:hypothetical protein
MSESTSGLSYNESGLSSSTSGLGYEVIDGPNCFPISGTTIQSDVSVIEKEIEKLETVERDLEYKVSTPEPIHTSGLSSSVTSKDWNGIIESRIKGFNQSIKDAPQEQFKTIPQALKAELEYILKL